MKNQHNLLLTIICVMLGIFASGTAVALEPPHPYHVSIAEVNWNPQSQKFEVALCLWPADLEKALARQTGRSIDLAQEPDIDRLMKTYVSKRFFIHSKSPGGVREAKSLEAGTPVATKSPMVASNAPKTSSKADSSIESTTIGTTTISGTNRTPVPANIKWYGHEADAKKAWLYFEIAGDAEVDWSIESRVFFELNDDQLNHVQWSGTGKTETLVCNSDNPEISLPKK